MENKRRKERERKRVIGRINFILDKLELNNYKKNNKLTYILYKINKQQ